MGKFPTSHIPLEVLRQVEFFRSRSDLDWVSFTVDEIDWLLIKLKKSSTSYEIVVTTVLKRETFNVPF